MAEWLSHVLLAYALATLLSWRHSWITPQYKTLAMIGSFVPDLNRFELLISEHTVEALLGIPFSWSPLHFLSGSFVAVAIGSLLVAPRYRARVLSLLLLGTATHHAVDLFLISLSGHSYSILWPLTQYAPPTPSLYLSTDRWPALVVGAVATTVWVLDRRHGG